MIKKRNQKKKGQSTLEYIILVTGVIAVLIIFLKPNGGIFTKAFDGVLNSAKDGMVNMSNRLSGSWPSDQVGTKTGG